MNLTVDYGNSAAKVGIFDNQTLTEKRSFAVSEALKDFLEKSIAENIIVSSVKIDPHDIASWAIHCRSKFIMDHTLPIPVTNLYKTPSTIGMDRLAAVCGARWIFPSHHVLVIDAGTCITYDFIDKEGYYHGGAISLGLSMRFQALHTFTAKLPLVSPKEGAPLTGDTTETCILSGVINGTLAEVESLIAQYGKKFEDLRVILCGGDSAFFENKLKASIFASPELVLIGLNSILNHNVNQP